MQPPSLSNLPPPDFSTAPLTEAEVVDFAAALATGIQGGEILLLRGGLGAGKTFFARAFAQGIGVASGVNSPTYVILCSHPAKEPWILHHLDFYRFTDSGDAEELGLEELCHPGSIVVAEWPDRCPDALPSWTLLLGFEVVDEECRRLHGWWGDLPFDRSTLKGFIET